MNVRHTRWLFAASLVFAASPILAQETTPEPTMEMSMEMTAEATMMMEAVTFPAEIVIPVPGLQPEGVDFDAARQRFLFGSLTQGTIHAVGEDLTPVVFADDENLMSTVGIQVDAANDRLLATNSSAEVFTNPSAAGMAGLVAYNLETGEQLFNVDLGTLFDGRHFANDVAVDADGNAYVTDSFSPVIYRVDVDGNAEIFAENELFVGPMIGLNGIDLTPSGDALLVSAGNQLVRVPLEDPTNVTPVELPEEVMIDGLIVGEDGVLYAVNNTSGGQFIITIESDESWAVGEITNQVEANGGATTITLANGVPYNINAYLNNQTAQQYEIVQVSF